MGVNISYVSLFVLLKMVMWTPLEISYVVEAYLPSGLSIVTAQTQFRQHFQRCEAPSRKVIILRAVQNFRDTSIAIKKRSPGRP